MKRVMFVLSFFFFLNVSAQVVKGPDRELEAITPIAEAVSVGLAGDDPSDIARYLLASGANSALISPNGKYIALSYSITGKRQLWLIDVDKSSQPKQLTFGNGISFIEWLPDSSGLIYGADNNGNELESYYYVSVDGSKEAEILPTVEGGYRLFGGVSSDNSTIYYASSHRNGLDFDIYMQRT